MKQLEYGVVGILGGINAANELDLKAEDVNVVIPQNLDMLDFKVKNGATVAAQVTPKPGAQLAGEVMVTYDRVDLGAIWKMCGGMISASWGHANVHALLPEFATQFGIVIKPEDVVNHPITWNGLVANIPLEAEPSSLGFQGSVVFTSNTRTEELPSSYDASASCSGYNNGGGAPSGRPGKIANKWSVNYIVASKSYLSNNWGSRYKFNRDVAVRGMAVTDDQVRAAGLDPAQVPRVNRPLQVWWSGWVDHTFRVGVSQFAANTPWNKWRQYTSGTRPDNGRQHISYSWAISAPGANEIIAPYFYTDHGEHGINMRIATR